MAKTLPGYEIIKQIGVGARSTIYLATRVRSLGQAPGPATSFAVKHVIRDSEEDDRFIAQVEREYDVSHRIKHPYLRHSYELQRIRKLLQIKEVLLAMEYVNGLPLESALPNRLNTFLTVFQKVARGLQALHEFGHVHADIKPTNIILGPKGVVKIIDFGQSCPIGHKKERIQGTPDYIAPEQVERAALDERTDIYNLGATMYWVLTSENYPTPLQGTDARGGMRLVVSDKPLAPIELNDKIPRSLSQLVMECCRENPAERPADMQQVVARLAVVQKLWSRYRDDVRAQWMADGQVVPGAGSASEVSDFGGGSPTAPPGSST